MKLHKNPFTFYQEGVLTILKRVFLYIAISIILISVIIFYYNDDGNQKPLKAVVPKEELPTEEFIRRWMLQENGSLKTYLKQKDDNQKGLKEEALSESLGLWMNYAVYKQDFDMFQESYATLKKIFITKGDFILWKVSNEKISTNALIDDMRVISALLSANKLWAIEEYKQLAEKLSSRVIKSCIYKNHFVDFYDMNLQQKSHQITLSYLDYSTMKELYEMKWIPKQLLVNTKALASAIPSQQVFYAKTYDFNSKKFIYEDTVSLIDQVYIALHLAKTGVDSEQLLGFLKREFQRGKLFGQYDTNTLMPAVSYESPALYGLTILYCLEIGETKFAESLYQRMIQFRVSDPDDPYYGGYIDRGTQNTHIFDNLLPLLAERRMMDEEILHAE